MYQGFTRKYKLLKFYFEKHSNCIYVLCFHDCAQEVFKDTLIDV